MKKTEITLKNTKAEILEALNDALEREKNMASIKFNPEKEEKEKVVKKAVESSKVNVEQNIFSEELNKKFKDLEIAIKAEEEKLKSLYGIEGELNNLTLVINAGKDFITSIENDKKLKSEELNLLIKELEDSYNSKKAELNKEYEVAAKVLKTQRERENEEYTYNLKREREISNNKWEDEKALRESVLKKKEDETELLLKEVKEKDEYLKSLEVKVNGIPELLEKEAIRVKKEVTNELEKEHKYQVELLTKDFKNTIDRQNDRIDALKDELSKSNELNGLLQEKMDKAYSEVKELATKTVESSGGLKILNNNQND